MDWRVERVVSVTYEEAMSKPPVRSSVLFGICGFFVSKDLKHLHRFDETWSLTGYCFVAEGAPGVSGEGMVCEEEEGLDGQGGEG